MRARRESVKLFANTTSVQNLDPETVLKFMNSNAIDKCYGRKETDNVIPGDFLPTCSCVLVDFNT